MGGNIYGLESQKKNNGWLHLWFGGVHGVKEKVDSRQFEV